MPDTREQLLDATGLVLAREGYAGLTTQAVADEVGVSHPAVHYHFDTKADLVVSFAERTRAEIIEGLEGGDDQPPGERLASILRGLVGGLPDRDDRDAAFTRALLALHVRAAHDEGLHGVLAGMDRDVLDLVTEVIREGIEAGDFAPADPAATATLLLCAVDGAALRVDTLGAEVAGDLARAMEQRVLADLYTGDPPSLLDGPGGDGP